MKSMKSMQNMLRNHPRLRLALLGIVPCLVVLVLVSVVLLRGPLSSAGANNSGSPRTSATGGPSSAQATETSSAAQSTTTANPATPPTITATSAKTMAGSLDMSLQLSPGPYFLSELVSAHMTLANHSQTSYTLQGVPTANDCDQALGTLLEGGAAPQYDLPTTGFVSCPFVSSTLAPGQTWTVDSLFPLTASGSLTLTAQARFIASAANGSTSGPGPFGSHWPQLHISVASIIPANRTISLHPVNASSPHQVTIAAPPAASAHLYYIYNITCHTSQGTMEQPHLVWQPVTGATLSEPGCSGSNETWSYSVASPGYAVASGKYPA